MDKMDLIPRILKSITASQVYTILLLGYDNYRPVKGKTWLQKEMFLISNNIEALEEDANFKPDFMGPYSESVDEALTRLLAYKIIESNEAPFKLTDFGKEVFKIIKEKIAPEKLEIVSDFKVLLNDMTYNELIGFIYVSYPEFVGESVVKNKVFPKREEIALNLLRKNKVSIAKAAEIADVPLENFIQKAKRIGVVVYSE